MNHENFTSFSKDQVEAYSQQKVSQEEQIKNRAVSDPHWRFIPLLAIAFIVAFVVLTSIYFSSKIGSPFKDSRFVSYLICFLTPIMPVVMFPLYHYLLFVSRNAILKLFLAVTILSASLITLLGIIWFNLFLILWGLLPICFTLLYLWCLWNEIKLAALTIQCGLLQLGNSLSKIFWTFFLPLLVISILLSSFSLSSVFLTVLLETDDTSLSQTTKQTYKQALYLSTEKSLETDQHSLQKEIKAPTNQKYKYLSTFEYNLLITFLSFSTASLVYLLELLSAIAFIFGAAFFNQASIHLEDAKNSKGSEEIKFETVCSEAKMIAMNKSLGVACLGSLLITIVSLLRSSAEQKNNEDPNLGTILLECLLTCLEEILRFLTSQAYVYTALYGKGLFESGKMGLESFKTSGFVKYFNYTLSSNLLNIMASSFSLGIGFIIGTICYFFGGGVFFATNETNSSKIANSALIGVLFSFVLFLPCKTVNNIVGGNVAAQIAVYVEDPDRLKKTHPNSEKFSKYIRV